MSEGSSAVSGQRRAPIHQSMHARGGTRLSRSPKLLTIHPKTATYTGALFPRLVLWCRVGDSGQMDAPQHSNTRERSAHYWLTGPLPGERWRKGDLLNATPFLFRQTFVMTSVSKLCEIVPSGFFLPQYHRAASWRLVSQAVDGGSTIAAINIGVEATR